MKYYDLLMNYSSQRSIINQYFSLKDDFMMTPLHAVPSDPHFERSWWSSSWAWCSCKKTILASDGYMLNKVGWWLIVVVNGKSWLQMLKTHTKQQNLGCSENLHGVTFEALVKFLLVTSCISTALSAGLLQFLALLPSSLYRNHCGWKVCFWPSLDMRSKPNWWY